MFGIEIEMTVAKLRYFFICSFQFKVNKNTFDRLPYSISNLFVGPIWTYYEGSCRVRHLRDLPAACQGDAQAPGDPQVQAGGLQQVAGQDSSIKEFNSRRVKDHDKDFLRQKASRQFLSFFVRFWFSLMVLNYSHQLVIKKMKLAYLYITFLTSVSNLKGLSVIFTNLDFMLYWDHKYEMFKVRKFKIS